MAGPIRIAVLADAGQAKRELNSVAASTSSLGSKLGSFGKAAGAAVATGLVVAGAAAVKFGVATVKSASDAQQSLGATRTVFGKYADTVISESNKAATALGLSANEYRELSNVTGASLAATGLPLEKVTGLTAKLNERAADLAATFGGTTKESIEAVSSLLRGEADPIERYGVSIKQSDVNARLAAKGLDNLTGSALKQAEQQARLDLLFQQTSKSQGAFARESNTLAGQQQRLGAQFENLKAKIGTALLPVITTVVAFLSETALPAFERFGAVLASTLGPAFAAIRDAVSSLVVQLAPVGEFFANNTELIKGAAIGLGIAAVAALAFGVAMGVVAVATSPITGIVLAIAALGAGLYYAYQNSETFRAGVLGIVAAFQNFVATVTPIVNQVVAAVVAKFRELQPQIRAVWASVQNIIRSALQVIRTVITTVTNVIKTVWQNFGANLLRSATTSLGNTVAFIRNVFKIIEGIFKVISSALRGDWSGMWNGIKQIASGALGAIRALVSQGLNILRTVFSTVWTALKGIVSRAWDGIKSAVQAGINAMLNLIRGLPGKIVGAIGDLGSVLYNAGKELIGGLINGIESMIGSLKDKVGSVASTVKGFLPGSPVKEGPLRSWNRNGGVSGAGFRLMEGLAKGIADGSSGVKKALTKITDLIEKSANKKFKDDDRAAAAVKTRLKSLRDEYAELTKIGKLQDKNADRLEKAADRYKTLVDAAKQYAASVKDAVVGFGSIIGLGADETGAVAAGRLAFDLAGKVQEAARFEQAIESLRGRLNDTSLRQLIDAGAEQGLATAEALASGSSVVLDQINQLTRSVAAVGGRLGSSAAQQFNQAGINAGAAMVRGIEREAGRLDVLADRMGERLVRTALKGLSARQGPVQAPRNTARQATAQQASQAAGTGRREREQAALQNQQTGRLVSLAAEQNKILLEVLRAEREGPEEFGRMINGAVVAGMRGRAAGGRR